MFVDIPNARSTDDHPSVYLTDSYTQTYGPATSMPLTQSGPLKKLIIAAQFDVTVSAGWPELHIIRNAAVAFSTGTREPKPTGYLNVYEYHISADMFEVKPGDMLNISWHITALDDTYLNRFYLAYYCNNDTGISFDIPVVSLVVGDCVPEADLLTQDNLYCNTTSNSLHTLNDLSVVIGMVMSFSLIIILLILVITSVIVIRRRKKFTPINNVDSTGINRYATTSEINSYLRFVSIL